MPGTATTRFSSNEAPELMRFLWDHYRAQVEDHTFDRYPSTFKNEVIARWRLTHTSNPSHATIKEYLDQLKLFYYWLSHGTSRQDAERFFHHPRRSQTEAFKLIYADYQENHNTINYSEHDSEYKDDCPICLSEPSEQVFKCDRCHHEVCADCMDHWLKTHVSIDLGEGGEHLEIQEGLHRTCPYCRVVLNIA
jgi:hypothetical protein